MSSRIDTTELVVSPSEFFQIGKTERIRPSVEITLSDHSYLPKADDPRADWVASVAVPAFKTLAQMGFLAPKFCTIGTGVSLDVLAAVEILRSRSVGFTDLHEDVLEHARQNIRGNLLAQDIELIGGAGDILAPLAYKVAQVDVVYENLPNIPMAGVGDLDDGQTSSTFIEERREEVPASPRRIWSPCTTSPCSRHTRSSGSVAGCSRRSGRGCRCRRSWRSPVPPDTTAAS